MENRRKYSKIIRTFGCFLGMLCFTVLCFGQKQQDNRKTEKPFSFVSDDYKIRLAAYGGSGITEQAYPVGSADTSDLRKLVNLGLAYEGLLSLELGYLGFADDFDGGNALFSSSVVIPPTLGRIRGTRFDLPLALGYTQIFGSGNAVNFGVGIDAILSEKNGIRFEVRDYFKLSGSNEHNVVFHVAFLRFVDD